MLLELAVFAQSRVEVKPDARGLPGSNVLGDLLDGFAFWGLIAAAVMFIASTMTWMAASASSNHNYTANGRRGAMVCAAGALLIGAAAAIINFAVQTGGKVR